MDHCRKETIVQNAARAETDSTRPSHPSKLQVAHAWCEPPHAPPWHKSEPQTLNPSSFLRSAQTVLSAWSRTAAGNTKLRLETHTNDQRPARNSARTSARISSRAAWWKSSTGRTYSTVRSTVRVAVRQRVTSLCLVTARYLVTGRVRSSAQ